MRRISLHYLAMETFKFLFFFAISRFIVSLPAAFAYIKFDKLLFDNNDNISGSRAWLSRSYDKHVAIINLDTMYHYQIEREQQRINISINDGEDDRLYSKPYLFTTLSPCKFSSGVLPTIVGYLVDSNKGKVNLSCPYRVHQHYPALNITIVDSMLPPMPIEIRFRFESRHYGIIKKKKGLTYMFSFVILGRYRR